MLGQDSNDVRRRRGPQRGRNGLSGERGAGNDVTGIILGPHGLPLLVAEAEHHPHWEP